jgi:hypothetical protein
LKNPVAQAESVQQPTFKSIAELWRNLESEEQKQKTNLNALLNSINSFILLGVPIAV